ncbi:MAG: HAD family phosphatase, partial [Kiritimatiellae bacterium]|nr:HAD family phosphatase [Kiritimatiellia bacterium]
MPAPAVAARSSRSAAARSDLKPAAFLFDLDGTLVDTEEAWAGAIVDFLAECGVDMTVERILPSIVGRNWLD